MQSAAKLVKADLDQHEHQQAVVDLLNSYAADPLGNGQPLPSGVRSRLVPGLRDHPTTMIFLAFGPHQPVGIAVCFRGFSTFAARPLMNIHDFYVIPEARGHGVGRSLLEMVQREASDTGCCKLTLEVQENNHRAQRIYGNFGFERLVYVPEAGSSLMMVKPLTTTDREIV